MKGRLLTAITWALVLLAAFPLGWMVLTSVKPAEEFFASPPTILPRGLTLDHYARLLRDTPFLEYFGHSVVLSVSTTALVVVLATAGAWGLTRYAWAGREWVARAVLAAYLLPSVVLILPLYLMLVRLGLANTIASLVLAYASFALPYALWLLRAFMAGIPRDLESAALIDGASRLGAFVDVVLPQALPGIVSTALFTFILAWNEYLFALVLVNTDEARPLTTGVMSMLASAMNVEWPLLMAASVLMSVPLILMLGFLQSYLARGLSAGGVKG